MGRLLLVLVAVALALFITVAKATHCISNIDCVEVGETCTASEAFDACGADGLPACRACSKSICDDALGVCRAPADLGQPCGAATTDAICSPNDRDEGYPGDECSNSVCVTTSSPFFPGEACGDAWVANTNNSGGCITGECINGTCPGVAAGADCSFGPCVSGYYCSSESGSPLCTPVRAAGDTCSGAGECAADASCFNGACVKYFSVVDGGACGVSYFVGPHGTWADILCQAGHACFNGTCYTVESSVVGTECTTANETCSGGAPSGGYACGNVTEADPCDVRGLICLPQFIPSDVGLANAWAAYTGCLATNNCSSDQLPFQGATIQNCAQRNCEEQWDEYNALLPALGGNCFTGTTSGSTTGTSTSGIPTTGTSTTGIFEPSTTTHVSTSTTTFGTTSDADMASYTWGLSFLATLFWAK